MSMKLRRLSLLLALTLSQPALAARIEVMHWWTAGGEAKAVQVLKDSWIATGNQWQDFAVSGGGGKSAMTVLRSRALAATPPQAAQLKGSELQEWASLGFLRDLTELAQQEQWDLRLPPFVRSTVNHQGHYIAAPIGIHRVNWLWINRQVFERLKLTPPTSWPALLQVAKQLKQAGIAPLAVGNDPWQLGILFESVALGTGGSDFFRRAFINQEAAVLESETMVQVLQRFHALRDYVPAQYAGLKWNQATRMLIEGQAAMQVMGDWVKGELTTAGLTPGAEILCLPAPGSAGKFSYNLDSIAMFKVKTATEKKAQLALAKLVMTPQLQLNFNRLKGSIPALRGLPLDDFDSCARDSARELDTAGRDNQLVPSMAEGMATSSYVQQAILDVLTTYFNAPAANAQQTAHHLARAISTAR